MRICRVKLEQERIVLALIGADEQVRPLLRAGQNSGPEYITTWAELSEAGGGGDLYRQVPQMAATGSIGTYLELEQQERLLAPLDRQEVWAAGVTYWRSREARVEESQSAASLYDLVYEAERPELFFKATAARVSGPGQPIGVRRDSRWTVPEPELALLLDTRLQPLGFTICNDVTARDIEGANPLYLPQAKIFEGCCAVGPFIQLFEQLPPRPELRLECTVRRPGSGEVFHGGASTAQLKRSLPELLEYLGRSNRFPDGVLLSTGTCIVPPDDFSMQEGDSVEIEIEGLGRLANPVRLVG